jgi:hypothetical protein
MKKLTAALAFLVTATITTSASAQDGGLFIEPAITYESGTNSITWPVFGNSTGNTKGPGFDLKLGGHVMDVLFLALDASYSKPGFTNSAVSYDAAADENLFGVVIGGQMPIVGLRIWGGYIFDGQLDPAASNGYDVKFTRAQGYKLGAGFRVLMVSLNVEYSDVKFGNTTLQASPATFAGTLDEKLQNKTTLVSVSMPFTI